MADGSNSWTKWWWLRVDQMTGWSGDEWKAFAAFMFIWLAQAIFYAILGLRVVLKTLPFSLASGLLVSFLVAALLSFIGLRSMTATFFGKTVIKGDDAAAARLGGRVHLPTNESWIKATWWIDTRPYGRGTRVNAERRMMLVSCLVFIPFFLLLARLLMDDGISERIAALIGLIVVAPIALYAGRRISIQFWPDLIKQADEQAIAMENKLVPPRT